MTGNITRRELRKWLRASNEGKDVETAVARLLAGGQKCHCGPHLPENGTRSQRPGPSRETGRIVKVERSRRGIRVLAGQRTLNSPLQGMLRTSP